MEDISDKLPLTMSAEAFLTRFKVTRDALQREVTVLGPKGKLDSTIKKSTSKIAILAYKLQGRMGHYITIKYEKNNDKQFCIYNCAEGQNGPHKEESIDRFVESDNKKILCLITLK